MQQFWITFTDGTKGCCDGANAFDAKRIAEHVSGKTVAPVDGVTTNEWSARGYQIAVLPYPATPIVWKFEHPVYGACPPFCFQPDKCAGKTSCPRPKACDD